MLLEATEVVRDAGAGEGTDAVLEEAEWQEVLDHLEVLSVFLATARDGGRRRASGPPGGGEDALNFKHALIATIILTLLVFFLGTPSTQQ